MARSTNILCIDVGSTAVRLAEFSYPSDSMVLQNFKVTEYSELLTEANRHLLITSAVRQALEETEFTTDRCHVSVSGQAAFMRFVKLPPVREEEARILQIIEYEAQQNVPFPMNEVIWDHQLFTTGEDDGDLEVMFVVIKNEIVETVARAITDAGLEPEIVDFAPAALYNVARANHVGENECSMVLNIGGRCTTLLFVDGGRFFARTIPIAGFSITQQIAKEFGISNEEAEALKRAHGFVALGGAYEEPESEVAATISKIVRNVMTRLHGEINRSISVYRAQQKGRKPSHLYLAGGSSTMMFTEHFFSEKLRMEVSYLNPFKIVTIEDNMVAPLQEHAHLFAEVVGVGLRGLNDLMEVPVDVNLVPESIKKKHLMRNRVPFLIASAAVWIAALTFLVLIEQRVSGMYKEATATDQQFIEKLAAKVKVIKRKQEQVTAVQDQINDLDRTLGLRYRWLDLLNAIQRSKPMDVWITGIERMKGPQVVAAEGDQGPEGSDLDIIFSAQVHTVKSADDSKEGDLNWLKVRGQGVFLPEKDAETDTFSRPMFTPVQEEELIKKADLEGLSPAARKKRIEEIRQSLRVSISEKGGTILAQQFRKILILQPEIYNTKSETEIISFNKDVPYDNIEIFEIQINLAEPIGREE